jgi:hypothetical protein
MPVFAALGAECTVMDYSQSQLGHELAVATREGYLIDIVKAGMTVPFPFNEMSLDIIFPPCPTAMRKRFYPFGRSAIGGVNPGGLLLAGLDNGLNYVFDETKTSLKTALPFNPLRDPRLSQECLENNPGIQISHTLEEQMAGH